MSIKEDSNTHFAKAQFMQEGVHDWQGREGETDTTMICTALDALVESNLAVAYEARTANKIAYMAQMALQETKQKISLDVAERLDLA